MSDKVLLVDGPNLLVRAVKATAHARMSAQGLDTGPIHVFITSLARHVREERPAKMVVCWDAGPSERRVGLYPQYKGNRKQRSPEDEERQTSAYGMAKHFLALAGIAQDTRQGQEADDLIAAYWHKSRGSRPTVILSGDKDFFQLLTDGTEQVRLTSGSTKTDRWNTGRVQQEMGVLPQYIPLLMSLTGDAGDNVPGVYGIGPKTAVKLLHSAEWDLDRVTHPKVVAERAMADLSLLLVDLRREPDFVVPQTPVFEPTIPGTDQAAQLLAFLDALEMKTIAEKFLSDTLWH